MVNYSKDKINILFFDDTCALCSYWVKFIMNKDKDGSKFVFSPINSNLFKEAIPENIRKILPDSIIVLSPKLDLYFKTEAVCYILKELSGRYLLASFILNIFPLGFANFFYDLIAKNRKRIFKKNTCEILTPEFSRRILID